MFDTKCEELARHFIAGTGVSEGGVPELAQVIQDAVEGWVLSRTSLTIYFDDAPYEVMDYYRDHGHTELPPTPTLSGAQMKAIAGRESDYLLFECERDGSRQGDFIENSQAVKLRDGMTFAFMPPHGY